MKKGRILILATSIILACAKVPITGRKQLKMIPSSDIQALSYQQYGEFLQTHPRSTDGQKVGMVKRVGKKIQVAVEQYMNDNGYKKWLRGYDWEFNLIEDPTMNAWCMPGGKVVFYTGILNVCQDEAGIAVVMGHEVAHAIARHGNERMSQGMVQQLGVSALGSALKTQPVATQNIFMQSVGIGTQLGVMLPFSRKHEAEADHMGLIFMAMAGYDPEEAPKFWERMDAMAGGTTPEFMSTHPSNENRIKSLKEKMPEALKYYKN